jgi:hypothetical protein
MASLQTYYVAFVWIYVSISLWFNYYYYYDAIEPITPIHMVFRSFIPTILLISYCLKTIYDEIEEYWQIFHHESS